MKKIIKLLASLTMCFALFGCSQATKAETLDEMMDVVYSEIKEDELPMMIERQEVTEENEEWFLQTTDLDYKEALASESGVGSVAHSVVLIRMNDANDVEEAKKILKDSVDGYKWICVGVEQEDIIIDSKDDVIVIIIDGFDLAERMESNFIEKL